MATKQVIAFLTALLLLLAGLIVAKYYSDTSPSSIEAVERGQ
jgi:hypothetical protein